MKYYVTMIRSQKVLYSIEAESKNDAKEIANFYSMMDHEPDDIGDPSYNIDGCISHMDYLLLDREEKNE